MCSRIFSVVSSQAPAGVCERFKITNNNKIPCAVKFGISPAAGPGDSEPPPPPEKVWRPKTQMHLRVRSAPDVLARVKKSPTNPKHPGLGLNKGIIIMIFATVNHNLLLCPIVVPAMTTIEKVRQLIQNRSSRHGCSPYLQGRNSRFQPIFKLSRKIWKAGTPPPSLRTQRKYGDRHSNNKRIL